MTHRLGQIGLGTMPLSLEGRPSRQDALHLLREVAYRFGHMDTADVYDVDGSTHHGERLIAEALGGDGVVTTKGGVVREGDDWRHVGTPEHLRAACESSLVALGRERIDLYYLHAIDPDVPVEESVGALAGLQAEGKIAAIGVSNVDVEALERARGEAVIEAVQNEASPFVTPCPLVRALCRSSNIPFVAYAPLGGWRAGRIAHEARLSHVGDATGLTNHEVTLAWLLAEGMIPLPGASRVANAWSSLRAAEFTLDAVHVETLRSAYW